MQASVPRVAMSPARRAVVEEAFTSMDAEGSGVLLLAELLRVFDPIAHPRVREGVMAPSAARDMVAYQLGDCAAEHEGYVTLEEFVRFHEKVSDEVDEERTWDCEGLFTTVVRGMWRVGQQLRPTGIIPTVTMDAPTALAAALPMDLLWVRREESADDLRAGGVDGYRGSTASACPTSVLPLVGFHGVVKPIFARRRVPVPLQGYFAFPMEVKNRSVRFLPLNPTVIRPMDFIWEYDEGKWAGYEGIIYSSIDRSLLPPELQPHIVTHDVAVARKAEFLQTSVVHNPMYHKSSSVIGYGVVEECKKMNLWKQKSLEGNVYGQVYHGRTGKFTKSIVSSSSTAATGMNT